MNPIQTDDIVRLFRSKGLKATPQRIAVYNFLCENPVHPDVETVYESVLIQNPSFSKTTVYNSLEAMAQHGIIIPVKIDSDKIRYDADTSFHGHFKCERCGNIYDFKCAGGSDEGLNGFDIRQRDVYYSGICCRCKNKEVAV